MKLDKPLSTESTITETEVYYSCYICIAKVFVVNHVTLYYLWIGNKNWFNKSVLLKANVLFGNCEKQ